MEIYDLGVYRVTNRKTKRLSETITYISTPKVMLIYIDDAVHFHKMFHIPVSTLLRPKQTNTYPVSVQMQKTLWHPKLHALASALAN